MDNLIQFPNAKNKPVQKSRLDYDLNVLFYFDQFLAVSFDIWKKKSAEDLIKSQTSVILKVLNNIHQICSEQTPDQDIQTIQKHGKQIIATITNLMADQTFGPLVRLKCRQVIWSISKIINE